LSLFTRIRDRVTRRFTPPAGANVVPYDPKLMAQMQQNFGPQKEQASAFSPGAPLLPTPGITLPSGPRGWTFPIGYNIGLLPRATESTSFDTLRNLASLYDGIQLCEQVWFDYINKLELDIVPRKEVLAAAGGDEAIFQKDIARYKAIFEYPDPGNDLDLHSWLTMAVREQLELDALPIYVRPTRSGGLYSLEIIDGTTIKPLIDDRGRKPLPPYPAYQQFWYGAPLGLYSRDEMLYHRETQRADSVYGLSRVERIILRVNQALRKQNKDMSWFTEGNLPAGILEMPPNDANEWTPDQVIVFQRMWDGLLSGNDKTRSRLKVIPPGAKFSAIESSDDLLTKFDSFLLNITVACFGLTMAELGFTENVNKSSGDSQENIVYRRAMRPLTRRYENLFTAVLRKYFHETRFVVRFRGFEETEDITALAAAYSSLTNAGILGLSDAGDLLKLPHKPDQPYIGRVFFSKDGPIFLDDMASDKMRNAAANAKLAGLQQAAQNPGAKPGSASETPAGDEDNSEKSSGNAAPNPTKPENSGGQQQTQRAAVPQHTGMMLALLLDPATAQRLAIKGGEPASELHVTLAYLGDMQDESEDNLLRPHTSPFKIRDAVDMVAAQTAPLTGTTGGIGRFAASSDSEGLDPLIALVDVPGLNEFRARLVEAVQAAGYFVAENHGYTPHITLDYLDTDEPLPMESVPHLPLVFESVWLCVGDERTPFVLSAQAASRAAPASTRALSLEYRRWRERALSDVKSGRALRCFTSDIIPALSRVRIEQDLACALTPDQVKQAFAAEQARAAQGSTPDSGDWQHGDPTIAADIAALRQRGVTHLQWLASVGACDECMRNNNVIVPVGSPFPTGAYTPQQHPHCECTRRLIYANGQSQEEMPVTVGAS